MVCSSKEARMLSPNVSPRALLRRCVAPRRFDADAGAYDDMVAPPSALIGADGRYPSGWYSEPPANINVEGSAKGGWRRLHRWFFVHFDSEDLFVSANLIDLRLGGNAGIVVLDKRTGEFTVNAKTGLLLNNGVQISEDFRRFHDRHTGSSITISADDRHLTFSLSIDGVTLEGRASALFDRPFVQSTRLGDTLGTLQMWGNLRLDEGRLTRDGVVTELPAGLYGAYDRSLGHRRLLENWNWIAACGAATAGETTVPFALHAALDRAGARPHVDGRKFALWVGDRFAKLSQLRFDYSYTDKRALETTAWRITSDRGADCWVDLVFTPRFHRRDAHRIPMLFNVDHSQYFGEVCGEVCADGARYRVSDVFATTEDSMMVV